MEVAGAAAVLVGAVLVVAGIAKAADRGWPAAARRFGLPPALAPVLPVVEIVLGGLLVARVALPWTALAAMTILAGFTAAVAVHLARGDGVSCACFGSAARAGPVSWWTLARNALLLLLTAVAVAGSY